MSFHETQEAEQTCRALVDELIIIDIIRLWRRNEIDTSNQFLKNQHPKSTLEISSVLYNVFHLPPERKLYSKSSQQIYQEI